MKINLKDKVYLRDFKKELKDSVRLMQTKERQQLKQYKENLGAMYSKKTIAQLNDHLKAAGLRVLSECKSDKINRLLTEATYRRETVLTTEWNEMIDKGMEEFLDKYTVRVEQGKFKATILLYAVVGRDQALVQVTMQSKYVGVWWNKESLKVEVTTRAADFQSIQQLKDTLMEDLGQVAELEAKILDVLDDYCDIVG